MSLFLTLAYLFFIGSLFGWVLELFYRRFISGANPERKWINPGFCVGPYLPLYGSGLCILYLIASIGDNFGASPAEASLGMKIGLFIAMAVSMTLIEYISGLISVKIMKVRLWDYTDEWGNIQGLICPKFSLYWALIGAAYYFLIHSNILLALHWLSENLAFSFVIGFFFGVFTIDLAYSAHLMSKIHSFAEEQQVVVRYELLKSHIQNFHVKNSLKSHFLLSFRSQKPLREHLEEAKEAMESLKVKIRKE